MLSQRASRRLPVPASSVALDDWLFSLTGDAYRATARAHAGAGTFRTADGRRGLFDAEAFAAAFIVNHHVEEAARPDHVRMRSRESRAWVLRLIPMRLEVCWEMTVRPAGAEACDVDCRLDIGLPHRALAVVARALGVGLLQRRHVEEQMSGFAASILTAVHAPA